MGEIKGVIIFSVRANVQGKRAQGSQAIKKSKNDFENDTPV